MILCFSPAETDELYECAIRMCKEAPSLAQEICNGIDALDRQKASERDKVAYVLSMMVYAINQPGACPVNEQG